MRHGQRHVFSPTRDARLSEDAADVCFGGRWAGSGTITMLRWRSRQGVRRSVSLAKPPAMTEHLRHETARAIEPAHEAQARPLPGTKKIAILLITLAEGAQRAPLRARDRGRAGGV